MGSPIFHTQISFLCPLNIEYLKKTLFFYKMLYISKILNYFYVHLYSWVSYFFTPFKCPSHSDRSYFQIFHGHRTTLDQILKSSNILYRVKTWKIFMFLKHCIFMLKNQRLMIINISDFKSLQFFNRRITRLLHFINRSGPSMFIYVTIVPSRVYMCV